MKDFLGTYGTLIIATFGVIQIWLIAPVEAFCLAGAAANIQERPTSRVLKAAERFPGTENLYFFCLFQQPARGGLQQFRAYSCN